MLKIGDFSKLGKVSIRMLRHYDQIGILKPAHIDYYTGYRGYSIDQLPRLNRIIFLKEIGFSLSEVMKFLDNHLSVDDMKSMLIKRQKDIENEIIMAQVSLKRVEQRLNSIQSEGESPKYDINIKKTESFAYACHRTIVPHMYQMDFYCFDMYDKIYKELNKINVTPIGPEITMYYNEEYTETNLDVEAGIIIPLSSMQKFMTQESILKTRLIAEEENVAFTVYSGPFDGLERAIIELLTWIEVNDYSINGTIREIHLSGPAHLNDKVVESAIIELQIPISKIK
jgi:DNA-binding transcriptional MerR regulator